MNFSQEPLVYVNKYNKNIKELSILKRIVVDYPLLVRETLAKRLSNIEKKLPNNLILQIDSGYRTRKIQKKVWDFRYKQIKLANKNLPSSKIYQLTRQLVFNPAIGIP